MVIVYFDRNVFADICELRRGLTENDVEVIEQSVKSGSIIIPASATLFQETLGVLRESDEKYNQHIRTVFGLIHKEAMVKTPNDLLRDDCYSYAQDSPYQRLTKIPPRSREILELSKSKADLITYAEEASQRTRSSAADITEGLLAARVAGEERSVGAPADFNEVWERHSIEIIKELLDRVPRPIRRLCKKRGLKKMRKITSIQLYAIYYASLIHSGAYGLEGTPRKMREGDVGDFSHAVQASVASIFVTQESMDRQDKLPFILNQVPTKGFTVTSLNEFVKSLRNKAGVAEPAKGQ